MSTVWLLYFYNTGLPGGTRTPDLQLRRLLLYPVELRADEWWAQLGSNQRPMDYESTALTD